MYRSYEHHSMTILRVILHACRDVLLAPQSLLYIDSAELGD
jgi:hypothetical protein